MIGVPLPLELERPVKCANGIGLETYVKVSLAVNEYNGNCDGNHPEFDNLMPSHVLFKYHQS